MKTIGIQLNDNSSNGILMDAKVVVTRDSDNKIIQGLVVGNIMNQNQAIILIAGPGEFYSNPTLGVAIDDLTLDDDYLRYQNRILDNFEKDGLKVKTVELSETKPLKIEASYG